MGFAILPWTNLFAVRVGLEAKQSVGKNIALDCVCVFNERIVSFCFVWKMGFFCVEARSSATSAFSLLNVGWGAYECKMYVGRMIFYKYSVLK